MKRLVTAAGIIGLGLFLAACDGSAAGSCSSAQNAAARVTLLTDDLKNAQSAGKVDAMEAGRIAAQIMAAGSEYGVEKDHRSYCAALDKIRMAAGL